MNLSGINEFGLFHVFGSLPIAHALTRICAPLGTVNPQISTSDPAFRGSSSGAAGYNLNVSLSIACK
ncbi:hypothetical protein LINPERHAP2_LOCUS31347 [Linum perenne]